MGLGWLGKGPIFLLPGCRYDARVVASRRSISQRRMNKPMNDSPRLPGATHLECTRTGEHAESETLQTLSPEGKPYFARYDLEAIKTEFTPGSLVGRRADLWRYEEVLPVRDPACQIKLGEGWTPMLDAPNIALRMGVGRVWIKDEGQNPTGSFKARGLCLAVSRAKELGAALTELGAMGIECPVDIDVRDVTALSDKNRRYMTSVKVGSCTRNEML